MYFRGNSKVPRPAFEFQRNGPVVKGPAGHKPDFTLAITRPSSNIRNQQPTKTPRRTKMATLDEVLIVDLTKTQNLKKCKELDLSGRKLGKIDINTLRQLKNVKKIDCSDNSLSLEPFSVVPKLEELDLSCNGIKKFDFSVSERMLDPSIKAWVSMKKLNLGFNYCSGFIVDIMLMQNLEWLSLSNNNLSDLPPNMMHFTNLKYLNLASNSLNTDSSFFALATIPALETLILDNNQITQFPVFDFGFESLIHLSMKKNAIEVSEDIEPVLEIECLKQIDITDNPICLKLKEIPYVKKLFGEKNIELLMSAIKKQKPSTIPSKLRTIAPDPLCLPSFAKKHIQALNRKTPRKLNTSRKQKYNKEEEILEENEPDDAEFPTETKIRSNVFMTDIDNAAADEPQRPEIPETPLPDEFELDIERTSIWDEVPVIQAKDRKKLTTRTKPNFDKALMQLKFIVEHPDHRIRPRESPSTEVPEPTKSQASQASQSQSQSSSYMITRPQPTPKATPRKKKSIGSQLQARTEYTKTEIQQILRSMEERLSVVENDLAKADESGQNAVEVALDQKNFTNLHKQYEVIRAELLSTLKS